MTVELPILSLTIWLPILGAVLTLVSGDRAPRLTKWIALGFAVATFVASLPLYSWFQLGTAEMQFVERASWIPAFDVHYHLGVDGISMPLILLTTFMTVLVIIAGWEVIQYRPSQYMAAFVDSTGRPLDGGKNYKLHLPPNIPVANFWSVILYDNQTRSMLQTDQQWPAVSSQTKGLMVNPDSSVDVYFGPKAPEGKESNWVQTVPGKGWNTLLRLYGPLEPWFDKTWRPGEIEEVK